MFDADLSIASYAAFCRNFGDYETPKAGRHNWNEEAMETMVIDMEQPWLDIHSALQAHRSRTRNSMNEALLWSLTHLGKLLGHDLRFSGRF